MSVAKYAYAYARVRVRLAERLSAGKLRSLAEAKDWSEFFSSLLDSGYKEHLARLTPEKADTRTLEIALREDLVAAYEISLGLVGSEMCIRDRGISVRKGMSVNELVCGMRGCAFGARRLAHAVDIYEEMLKAKATKFLGLAGALVPAGMRPVLAEMLRLSLIHI